jgi:hypothetical protein
VQTVASTPPDGCGTFLVIIYTWAALICLDRVVAYWQTPGIITWELLMLACTIAVTAFVLPTAHALTRSELER